MVVERLCTCTGHGSAKSDILLMVTPWNGNEMLAVKSGAENGNVTVWTMENRW